MVQERTSRDYTMDIPEQVRTYTLGRTLGKGPMSVVKHATCSSSEKEFAVKVMPVYVLKSEKRYNAVLSVLRLCHQTISVGVIHVFEYFEESGLLFIVMDYCKNGTLYSMLNHTGKLNEEQCRTLFQSLVKAIQSFHAMSICHRGLTLESILITANGSPKICNLEQSHKIIPHQLLSSQCGQPAFAAPEVILHEPYDGVKSDMWSLGVILFCMATGRVPWNTENCSRMMREICEAKVSVPSDLSPQLGDLITSLLERSPQKRLSASECLQHPWLSVESRHQTGVNMLSVRTNRLQRRAAVSQVLKKSLPVMRIRVRPGIIHQQEQMKISGTRSSGRFNIL